jgi:hypothetical protein
MTPFRISISCTWRSSQTFRRRYLLIVIGVYTCGEKVLIYTLSHMLSVVYQVS